MRSSLITGIDIDHHSIKAVVLKPMGERYALVGYQALPITDDIFSENHTLEYQNIVKKLRELRKSLPFFSRNVVISVPDSAVISKVLQIDSELEDREKEFAIYQAFAHQSPFPVEDLSLDFVKLEGKRLAKSTTTSYQVYATRKEVVESRSQAMKKAGFRPIVADIQAHSLFNIYQLASRSNPQQSQWLLVDIGLQQTSLCAMPDNQSPFYKDIAYGIENLQQESLIECASSSVRLAQNTQIFINELIERLQRQLHLYFSLNSEQPINGIWLMGEGAMTPMLSDEIQRKMKLDCEVLNPLNLFENRVASKRGTESGRQSFGIAAGLAISGLRWEATSHAASN